MTQEESSAVVNSAATYLSNDCSVLLIKKPSPSSVFKRLVDGSGNLVGVYTMENVNGKKKYIIGDAKFAESLPNGSLNETAPGCSVGKIIPFMLKDLYAVAKNNPNSILVSFVNTESIMSFIKINALNYFSKDQLAAKLNG